MIPRGPSNKRKLLQLPYPENLLMTLLEGIVESIEVTPDIQAGLEYGFEADMVFAKRLVTKLVLKESGYYEN